MTGMRLLTALGAPIFLLAAFSSSTNYQMKSYDIGSGATNSSSSATYSLNGTVGEPSGTSASPNYQTLSNTIQAQQTNVPLAPTLSNGSNSYYNELGCIINTDSNPNDATYAIAVSTDSFATVSYVQATGALGSSPVFQTYTAWGGASGTYIVGLAPSTAYQVEVTAMQGTFDNSAYGPAAAISTVATSITFSLTPNTENLGTLTSGTVVSAPSNLAMTFTTNADYGGNVYIAGQNAGLKSTTANHTIAASTGNLNSTSEGFGVRGVNTGQTSGGPLAIASPFNGTNNVVGAPGTTFLPIFSSSAPINGGTATAIIKAKASTSTPAANNYQEVLTLIASASF
jgi:hypothetical protein